VLDAIVTKVGLAPQKGDSKPALVSFGSADSSPDDRAWGSKPPAAPEGEPSEEKHAAPEGPGSEEQINVVLEDELLVAPGADDTEEDSSPTQTKSAADLPPVLWPSKKK